jgi:hypothetical protein
MAIGGNFGGPEVDNTSKFYYRLYKSVSIKSKKTIAL